MGDILKEHIFPPIKGDPRPFSGPRKPAPAPKPKPLREKKK